jgi:hypothetical protein
MAGLAPLGVFGAGDQLQCPGGLGPVVGTDRDGEGRAATDDPSHSHGAGKRARRGTRKTYPVPLITQRS